MGCYASLPPWCRGWPDGGARLLPDEAFITAAGQPEPLPAGQDAADAAAAGLTLAELLDGSAPLTFSVRCAPQELFKPAGGTITTSPWWPCSGCWAGVDLRDVQIAARHADPRTTMQYDRARQDLDLPPNYVLAAYMASGTRPSASPSAQAAGDARHCR
jgi:hypothetical protein